MYKKESYFCIIIFFKLLNIIDLMQINCHIIIYLVSLFSIKKQKIYIYIYIILILNKYMTNNFYTFLLYILY